MYFLHKIHHASRYLLTMRPKHLASYMFVNKYDRLFPSGAAGLGLFDHNRSGRLVLPHAFKRRMPENPIAGPRRELDLDHHPGFDPIYASPVLPRDRDKWRIAAALLPPPDHKLTPN